MSDVSGRFAFPFLQPGQAQKEMAHNEALALLDLIVQPTMEAVGATAPPAGPAIGQCWALGAAPGGDWTGQGGRIAGWTEGGWRFVAPRAGTTAWSVADGTTVRWTGSAWATGALTATSLSVGGVQVVGPRRPAIADPAGGSVVDGQARTALTAILAALRMHGLIAT